MATTYDKASLVMIPSGYKDDKLYSVKPTDGSGDFTFSRDGAGASPATRVNASGLIEKGRTNEIKQSQNFADGAWIPAGSATKTSGQTDPFGGNTATRIVSTAVLNSGIYQVDATNFGTNNIRTASLWMKGAVGGEQVELGDATNRKVVTLTTSWVRYETFAIDASAFYIVYSNGLAQTWDIAFAQYEDGLVATDYIETTTAAVSAGLLGDMPRLDYSGGATCPSLLLEPSRVNAVAQSEYIGSYTKFGSSVTQNSTTSPEGVVNASTFVGNGSQPQVFLSTPITLSAGGSTTISAFAKADTNNFFELGFDGFSTSSVNVGVYNLSAGTATGTGADIEDYGNGWYRCILTQTIDAGDLTGAIAMRVRPEASFLWPSNADANGKSVFVYGTQAEASASYPTSYIPTYGSASTRAKDAPSLTSVSDLIGQEEGTFFIEWDNIGDTSRPYLALSAGGSTANRVLVYESGGVNAQIKIGGSVVFQSTTASVSGTIKAAVAYKTNDFVFYVNGTQYGTDSSGATFSGTTLNEVEFDHSNLVGASMKQCVVFKTRLTNAELAALTA